MQKILLTKEDYINYFEFFTDTIGFPSIILMENIGRSIAEKIKSKYFDNKKHPLRDLIFFCGYGENGGYGLVAARHLANALNTNITVYIVGGVSNFLPDTELNFRILKKLNIVDIFPILSEKDLSKIKLHEDALIVDAIFGIESEVDMVGFERKVIDKINRLKKEVISIDIPSGLNYTDNFGIIIKSSYTLSILGNKQIFKNKEIENFLGEVDIVDVGVSKFNIK